MSHNQSIKQKAIALRELGDSIPQIAKQLHLAKSTVSLWVTHVPLSIEIENQLRAKAMDGRAKGRLVITERRKKENVLIQSEAKTIVEKDFACISKTQWQMTAALLFWCEGTKRPSLSQGVRFMNADPMLVKTFLFALRHGFEIEETKLRMVLHLHEYHNETAQNVFWSECSGIPVAQFHRTYWKPNTGKRKHPDYPGCVSVRYPSAKLARTLVALYYALAQKIGA